MNQTLLWNFEFSPIKPPSSMQLPHYPKDTLLWEFRCFWPEHQKIVLCLLEDKLLNLGQYRKKLRQDCYYLLPDSNQNIKLRRATIFYKPILKKTPFATGFGPKIDLKNHSIPMGNALMHYIEKHATKVLVSKETYIFTFETQPIITLELSKLNILEHTYTSLCIEGHSQDLVHIIREGLLGDQTSCDYVTFLKNVVRP